MPSRPLRELVLVGGGHSHVQVLRRLAMNPIPHTRLTVVVDTPVAVYSGMVPGFVAGRYRAPDLEIDVLPLARRAAARWIQARAVGVEPGDRRILLEGRPPLPYDVASFDIGSTVAGLDLPGIRQHALATRPIAHFVHRLPELVERARDHAGDAPLRVLVVGGGAGGVELAFTLEARLRAEGIRGARVTLVHNGGRPLSGSPKGLVDRVLRRAAARGIEILAGSKVAAAEDGQVVLEDGERLPADLLLWVTGAASHPIFEGSGLATDHRGFVFTRPTLQVEGFDDLFAVGDCATLREHPTTPKAGVYAVRQGPVLSHNLRQLVTGGTLKRYAPQGDFLALLNLGDGTAVGSKAGLSFEGRWVMELKDRIDRRFMRRFQVLEADGALTEAFRKEPEMGGEAPMFCGGCAAKVGQTVLSRALARLGPGRRDPTVRLGLAAADDAVAVTTPGGELIVGSLDAFRAFTDDPFVVGRVAAVNALSDLAAKGVAPRWAQALVAIPQELASDAAEELLFQVLAGARTAFEPLDVSLVGGHTLTAPELLVGFHVEGVHAPLPQVSWVATEGPAARQPALRPGESAARILAELGTLVAAEEVSGKKVSGEEASAKAVAEAMGDLPESEEESVPLPKRGLRQGQELVLTKPLGTGVLFHADMQGRARGPWIEAALRSMQQPNVEAARVAREAGATAATDVTGYGLGGHLGEMLAASGAAAVLDVAALPALPGAVELLARGVRSTLHPQNAEARHGIAVLPAAAAHPKFELLFDPQTSGGLLFGVPAGRGAETVARLRRHGDRGAAVIGKVTAPEEGGALIEVVCGEGG